MNFKNGQHLPAAQVHFFPAVQLMESDFDGLTLTVCAATHPVAHRGETLDSALLTLEITAPRRDQIRVRAIHFLGSARNDPSFELVTEPEFAPTYEADETEIRFASGDLELRIRRDPWSMTYTWKGAYLTGSAGQDLAYIRTDWQGHQFYSGGYEDGYMQQCLGLSVGETVYGLGERFGPYVKNGQHVEIWNKDGGTSTDDAYKNVPFYLTSRGYGVLVNQPEQVDFEVASRYVSKVGFSVQGESLDYILIGGGIPKAVLTGYTDLTGKPPVLPEWSFGLWLSTSFVTDYDEGTVMHFIDGMQQRGIPLSVFHFDCFWMHEHHWTDLCWDSRVFPDPEGMIRRIHEKGVKVCVWINPYIAQPSVLFREGMEKGYLLKRPDGTVYQWDMWQPGTALVDFTNPEAVRWYQSKLKALLDMGVDCFKTDFGERIPTDVAYYDGSDPMKMHNYYSFLYNKAVFTLLCRERGEGEAIVFARSATAGGQQFPVHWGGDCFSDYVSMEQSLRGGLSLTMSGFGFWSHDIGGFEATATPDVYKRWVAFGLLSSHSRLHGSSSYRVPWNYDEEAVDVARFFDGLKLSLLPYIYGEAMRTHKTGISLMRSMFVEFPEDPGARYLDKQYMLGDAILVAPVFAEDGTAQYYLPEGTWTHYLTGEVRKGGRWCTETYDYFSLPLWVRENSLIPTQPGADHAAVTPEGGLEIRVYALSGCATTTVYHDGEVLLELAVEQAADGRIRVKAEGPEAERGFTLRFVNRAMESLGEYAVTREGEDTLVRIEGK